MPRGTHCNIVLDVQHRTVRGSSRLFSMRLRFDDNNEVIANQIEMRKFSCDCTGCHIGSDCVENWPDNRWKAVQLRLRDDAFVDVGDDEAESDGEVEVGENFEEDINFP